jgi:hypothetical protein
MVRLVLKPFLITVLCICLWLFLREKIPLLQQLKDDEKAMTSAISGFIAFWMIFGTFGFAKAYGHRSEAHKARDEKNFERFLICIKKRLHHATYAIIYGLSLLIIGGFFLVSFTNIICGIYSIGGVTFLLALYVEVVRDIDDPFLGIWNVEDIPEDWMKKLREKGIVKK